MSGAPGHDDIDCIELVERVTEYLDGAMDDADRARLEHHLGACPGCAEIVEQFRAVITLTGALRTTDVTAVDGGVRADLLAVFRTWRSERA
jgi:anti-sigma factor (TIGR02949 family)